MNRTRPVMNARVTQVTPKVHVSPLTDSLRACIHGTQVRPFLRIRRPGGGGTTKYKLAAQTMPWAHHQKCRPNAPRPTTQCVGAPNANDCRVRSNSHALNNQSSVGQLDSRLRANHKSTRAHKRGGHLAVGIRSPAFAPEHHQPSSLGRESYCETTA